MIKHTFVHISRVLHTGMPSAFILQLLHMAAGTSKSTCYEWHPYLLQIHCVMPDDMDSLALCKC